MYNNKWRSLYSTCAITKITHFTARKHFQNVLSTLTTPVVVLMQFILILDINLAVGASSGYLWPHSTFTEYILFSYGVRCGPIIMPIQCVSVISSSFSKPQLMVPSPTPFCPASSSSSNRKLRGTTDKKKKYTYIKVKQKKIVYILFNLRKKLQLQSVEKCLFIIIIFFLNSI